MTDGDRPTTGGVARRSGRSVVSRVRLTGALLILGVSLAGAVFYAVLNNQYLSTLLGQTLGPYSDALAERGFEGPSPEIWGQMAAAHHLVIVVEPADGKPFGFDADGKPLAPARMKRTGGAAYTTRTAPDGTRATLYWTVPAFRQAHLPLIGGLLVMIAAVVGAAFWFLHRQFQPLEALHRGVEAVARGDFEPRAPVVRDDEIGRVAAAFNAMAERVGEMLDDRERLLGDVSHELRSPIARMKVALELMPDGAKRQTVARNLREMESLISALLEREALRCRAGLAQTEPADLAALAGEAAAAFSGRGPGVVLVSKSPVPVDADSTLMKLLIHNLVDNAVKFSLPDSSPVELSLEASNGEVVLRMIDDGIGVPEGSEEDLFAPFVKLDKARGHRAGYGIGLNLCQRIAQLHDGALELLPRSPRGTEVRMTLPRRRNAATGDPGVPAPGRR
jgi:signal transduction histidine kinase